MRKLFILETTNGMCMKLRNDIIYVSSMKTIKTKSIDYKHFREPHQSKAIIGF